MATINGTINGETLNGTSSADTISGFGGDDIINGGDGNDNIAGESVSATYNGPFGNDTLNGEGGDDQLRGGAGTDTYDGGTGFDRVSFNSRVATQAVVANLITQTVSNDGFGNAETMVSIEALGAGTAYADHFTGDDNINILLGDIGDTLIANGGDDLFQLNGAPALIDGGAGIDTIRQFFGADGSFVPDTNNDGLADIIFADHGVTVDLHHNIISDDGFGNTGVLISIENVGGSDLDDTITGSNGDNVLNGFAGVDVLRGRNGDDVINGGAGNDRMDGDAGDDRFVFQTGFGADVISDFDAKPGGGQDLIDVSALGITFADVTVTDLGKDTLITIGADTILLEGVNGNGHNTIDASDFLFG